MMSEGVEDWEYVWRVHRMMKKKLRTEERENILGKFWIVSEPFYSFFTYTNQTVELKFKRNLFISNQGTLNVKLRDPCQ